MQFLGDTLEKIAVEKAGIIKPNTPVVVGEYQQDIAFVFEQKAKELDSTLYFANQNFTIDYGMLSIDEKQIFQVYKGNDLVYPDLKTDLLGLFQKKNVTTVLQSVELLIQKGFSINKKHIYTGFENAAELTGLKGRWQTIGYNPRIVCDIGHNEDGIKNVIEQIKTISYKNLHVVFGVVEDKNFDNILSLLPKEASYYFCKASIPRALNEKILQKKATEFNLNGKSYSTVVEAYEHAKQSAQKEDFIFVGGSTFVVADLLEPRN